MTRNSKKDKQRTSVRKAQNLRTRTEQHFNINEDVVDDKRLSKEQQQFLKWTDEYHAQNELTLKKIEQNQSSNQHQKIAQKMWVVKMLHW